MTTPKEATREALPEPLKVTWKFGNEFAPYHPQASHINPDHRDGWNACYRVAQSALESERQAHAAEIAGLRVKAARYDWLRQYPNNLDGRVYGPTYSKEGGGLLRRDTHLDAAIDAARAVSKQGEES